MSAVCSSRTYRKVKLKKCMLLFLFALLFVGVSNQAAAQVDTTSPSWSKKMITKMLDQFRQDSSQTDVNNPKTNEKLFNQYEGLTIRNIYVQRLPFGVPFTDSSKTIINTATRIVNKLHHLTYVPVIKRNLFFHKNDTIKPYLMADNERFLRQLPYLQDAEFVVVPIEETDSADIIVVTKDVFSLGGAIGSLGLQHSDLELREDNIKGSGNAAVFYAMYDAKRKPRIGLGGEYKQRNIGGSFVDGTIGYQSYFSSFQTPKEENYYYINLLKPLTNRYVRWIYELDLSYNETRNRYYSDSIYNADFRYNFYNVDAWFGYNIDANIFSKADENKRLRKLIGLRMIERQTKEVPGRYATVKNWEFADITGVLATVSFYRQNFYKTKYIYGFGRNEDIPEGLLFSFTGGYTIKEKEERPFFGFNIERSFFNKRNNYLSYTLRAEGYLNQKKLDDLNMLVSVNYFDHFKKIGRHWNQRFFLNFDMAKQIKPILSEPLFMNSKFGLPEFGTNYNGGSFRTTAKAESVFYSPWSVAAFRFAPFIFGNMGVFKPYTISPKFYTSVGAGIRTRNESFVFGTIEIKGYYFPQKDLTRGSSFRLDLSTNVNFKYRKQFINKPDFIEIN